VTQPPGISTSSQPLDNEDEAGGRASFTGQARARSKSKEKKTSWNRWEFRGVLTKGKDDGASPIVTGECQKCHTNKMSQTSPAVASE